jgi:transcription initiation factor TFIID subunit TAF12
MSEESSNNDNNTIPTTTESHSKRNKKEEIFGIPRDDVTLAAAAAGLGLAGLIGGKMLWDMMQNGQLPNPFQPTNNRVTYSDIYDQQRQQQEWEAQQRAQQQQQQQTQQVQQQPELEVQESEGNDPSAQTMPAFSGFNDDEDGVSYSTTVRKPRGNSFDRINGG